MNSPNTEVNMTSHEMNMTSPEMTSQGPMNHNYNSHVQLWNHLPHQPLPPLDHFLGILCLFLCMVGSVSNVFAYFFFRYKRSGLAAQLYMRVAFLDVLVCLIHIPIIPNFFLNREPGMMNNKHICTAWVIAQNVVSRSYATAVLLLSVSRTIAILFPFYRIRKRAVLGSYYVYVVLVCLHHVIQLQCGLTAIYSSAGGYCYMYYQTNPGTVQSRAVTLIN